MEPRLVASTVTAILLGLTAEAHSAANADDVMRRNLVATKVADSTATSTFRLINANGQQRVRETDGSTKLTPGTMDNRRLVHFLSPSDVRGTKTLLIEQAGADDNIWVYLPAMKKVRRLVSSNKRDSFVGTDFSYGDVIGHKIEDWIHKLAREEDVAGRACYVIESVPRDTTVADNSGYSKRISWIDKESYVAVRGEIYDLAGELLKKVSAEDIRNVDSKNAKFQPMKLTAENVQTGHKTVIEFRNFKANVGVRDDIFTARSLEK